MEDNIQAMVVALFAVSIGIVFTQMGAISLSIVGLLFIMGSFIIAITAFLIFLREWVVTDGTSLIATRGLNTATGPLKTILLSDNSAVQ